MAVDGFPLDIVPFVLPTFYLSSNVSNDTGMLTI